MTQPRLTVARAKLLRRPMSKPEIHLWCRLRAGALDGLDFRKQHPIGPFIADFFCGAAKLAVEVDGWLESQGVKVVRFPAQMVLCETEAVLDRIRRSAVSRMFELHGRDLRRRG